jgi:pSer/pThr/pTyr-binding forkhead associated (FHA) protein
VVVGERGETAVRFELEGEKVIGREATDILLDDEQVSRRHALIRVDDGRVEIADLQSANGTEVNGERITDTVTLAHGDAIKVGKTTLRLELPASMRGPGPADATVIADS